jgi:hypothetical protein
MTYGVALSILPSSAQPHREQQQCHNASRAMRAARVLITVAKLPHERLIRRRLITRVDLTSSLLSNSRAAASCFTLALLQPPRPTSQTCTDHPTLLSAPRFSSQRTFYSPARRRLRASTERLGLPSRIPCSKPFSSRILRSLFAILIAYRRPSRQRSRPYRHFVSGLRTNVL